VNTKDANMSKTFGLLIALALGGTTSACATMEPAPATAEQRAACQEMLAKMGEGATHSHSADKSGAVNPMAMTHAQCRRLIG
jgi:hypothetical protein